MTGGRAFAELVRALVLRPLAREPFRASLTIGGIAVGIAVIVAIHLANQSALRSFADSVDAVAGRANYQITPAAGTLDERVLLRLAPLREEGVRFAPVIDVEALVAPSGIPIRILGVDLLSDLHFRDYRWTRIETNDGEASAPGDDPPPIADFLRLFEPDAAILADAFAEERGFAIGSPVRFLYRDREPELTVRGTLASRGPATAMGGSIAILDIATAQSALGLEGRLSRIDLIVPEPIAPGVWSALESALPAGAILERPSRRNERVGRMLRAFRVNLFALAAVALLVGVFLVYNTVTISILRRRRDVGVAKTLGVSARQILAAFLFEGVAFGAIGSLAGVVLGWALAHGALSLVTRTIDQLYVAAPPSSPRMTAGIAGLGFAIGIGVSLLAALHPAWEASRLRPNALIRPGLYQRLGRERTLLLALVAAASLGSAWLLTLAPPVGGLPLPGYGAVVLVVAGFSLLAPIALRSAARAASRPLGAAFGLAGTLAAASLPASLRRIAIAGAALATAIAMMVSVAIMIGSFRETVEAWVGQTVQSDLWVRPARGLSNADVTTLPAEAAAALQSMPEVAAIDRFRGMDVIWRDSIITLGSGEFDVATRFGSIPMVSPRSHRAALRDALDTGGVLVSETLALEYGIGVGDAIELPAPGREVPFRVSGIYRDYSNDRGVVVMDRARWVAHFGDETSNTIGVFLRDGVDPEAARRRIEDLVAARYGAFVMTNAAIRDQVMRIFDQTFVVTWALLGVALVVAVLGIVNTLTALILERRREIALLRVLGMDRRQIATMVLLEAAIIGLVAAVLGLVAGWILSWILIFVINRQSFGWTIELDPPVATVLVSVAVTFLATVAAGLVPARLTRRIGLSAELKAE